jgi:hypothetical protein
MTRTNKHSALNSSANHENICKSSTTPTKSSNSSDAQTNVSAMDSESDEEVILTEKQLSLWLSHAHKVVQRAIKREFNHDLTSATVSQTQVKRTTNTSSAVKSRSSTPSTTIADEKSMLTNRQIQVMHRQM